MMIITLHLLTFAAPVKLYNLFNLIFLFFRERRQSFIQHKIKDRQTIVLAFLQN